MRITAIFAFMVIGVLLAGCGSDEDGNASVHSEGGGRDSIERVSEVVEEMELEISGEESKPIAFVTEALPFPMRMPQLEALDVEYDQESQTLVKGQAKIERMTGVFRGMAIHDFARAKGARIVQVRLGSNKPGSLLDKIMRVGTRSSVAPILRDSQDEIFRPVGYVIASGGWVEFKFGLDDTIRDLSEIPLGRVSATDHVRLIYHVAVGRRLVGFEFESHVQPLNLKVEERGY